VKGRQVNHEDSLNLIGADQGVAIKSGFYENAHRVEEPSERKNNIVELVVTADLGFAELTSATGYVDYDEDGQRDQTDLLLTFGYTYADFPTFTAFTAENSEENTFTQELRLVSTGDGPLSWIGGAFFSDADVDSSSLEFTPCLYDTDPTCPPGGSGVAEIPSIVSRFGNDVEYVQLEDRSLKEWAVFGELSYRFTDEWQVTVGGRYFDVEDDFTETIGFPLLNQILGIDPTDPTEQIAFNPTQSDESFDDFIVKLNTSYDLSDDVMVYGTFSQGYRNGGSNAIVDCSTLPGNPNVVCGTSDQLGYKRHSSGCAPGFGQVVADQAFAADVADPHELGKDHVRTNPIDKQGSHRSVGQPLHRCQHERSLAVPPWQVALADAFPVSH